MKKPKNFGKDLFDENNCLNEEWLHKPITEVSDEVFFSLIEYSPHYLQAPFALAKIKKWQEDLESKDRDVSLQAQDNLTKIGTTLALKKSRRKCYEVACHRNVVLKKIKDSEILNMRGAGAKNLALKELFKELFSDTEDAFLCLGSPVTYSELANAITARHFGMTSRTVERYYIEAGGYGRLLIKLLK